MDIDKLKHRLSAAGETIAAALAGSGREVDDVRIMAVTKMHPAEVVAASIEAGIGLIGENRVSEGGRKINAIGKDKAEFHLIGPAHRKELRQVLRDFHSIDSVGRLDIGEEIVRRIRLKGIKQPGVLLEVNTSGEEAKHGFPPDITLLEEVLGRLQELDLKVNGFLTVGPLGSDETGIRRAFAMLRELRNSLSDSLSIPLTELSMGMSDDFRWAVMEGATTVRLGRYLFGERPVRSV